MTCEQRIYDADSLSESSESSFYSLYMSIAVKIRVPSKTKQKTNSTVRVRTLLSEESGAGVGSVIRIKGLLLTRASEGM